MRSTSHCPRAVAIFAVLSLLLFTGSATAVIKVLTPLKRVLADEEFIFVAKVEKVDPEKPSVIFTVSEHLKGKAPIERMPVNLTGSTEAKRAGDPKAMLDRLEPGRELLIFTLKNENTYPAFGYLEGTWFQLTGTLDDDGKTIRWAFLNCEPYLRRTFQGTTAELKTIVTECLAGKRTPPEPNEKAPPGYGPLPEKKKSQAIPGFNRHPSPALFAVIPSFVLIGPLAIVAALFPGVAARLAVGMRRWRVFFVVASVNSTIALLYWGAGQLGLIPDAVWASGRSMAGLLLVVTFVGLVIAGQRYRRLAANDPIITELPSRGEIHTMLGLTLAMGLLVSAVVTFTGPTEAVSPAGTVSPTGQDASGMGKEFTAIAVGLLAATLYAIYRTATRHTDGNPPPPLRLSLSGESVGLAAMALFASVMLVGTGRGTSAPTPSLVGEVTEAASQTAEVGPRLVDAKVWFETPDYHEVMSGVTVTDDRVYFGTMKLTGFHKGGAVFCVDRATAQPVWRFTAGGKLMPVFTTPAVSNGKVYAGEGLHTESDRRMYCIDAATGKQVWAVETTSHTEGCPRIANGKLYFSAGNDGLFCANATDGQEVWHLRGYEQKLHIDTPPTVAKGKVFAGSGYNILALLALDAEKGTELWRTPTKLRSFGPALPLGTNIAFGLGTGNLMEDLSQEPEEGVEPETQPAGAILCLDGATGKEVWRAELPKSVHTRMTADARAVYASCRDGFVYAFDRANGKLLWKRQLGTAMTSGPVVVTHFGGAVSLAVYAVSSEGFAACLSPQDGRVLWSRNLAEASGGRDVQVLSGPTVTHAEADGSRHQVYIGAMLTNRNNQAKSAAVFRIEDVAGE